MVWKVAFVGKTLLRTSALVNQTNLRMDSDVERKKKKGVYVGVNRHRQDPGRSVFIYCS